jgi:amino acid permease
MRLLSFLIAIICVVAAVMYFRMPADQLPSFFPGYAAGSSVIHMKHAYAAVAGAVVFFALGWFTGRR